MTVTKQQQLEFAAKHIEKWKSGFDFVVIEKMNDGQLCVRWPPMCSEGVSKKEWQQERAKIQKQAEQSVQQTQPSKPAPGSLWHERGELPSVGCECEIKHKCWSEFWPVTVAAITKEYVIVVYGQCEQHYYLRDITFRPLRTEREKAIDEMVYEFIDHHGDPKNGERYLKMAAKLYDAGYRKIKP